MEVGNFFTPDNIIQSWNDTHQVHNKCLSFCQTHFDEQDHELENSNNNNYDLLPELHWRKCVLSIEDFQSLHVARDEIKTAIELGYSYAENITLHEI
jgi:hypothetical protein